MNCVLFAKMDKVFSKENKTLKKYSKIWKKYWKSQGILSVRKSGNPDISCIVISIQCVLMKRLFFFVVVLSCHLLIAESNLRLVKILLHSITMLRGWKNKTDLRIRLKRCYRESRYIHETYLANIPSLPI